MRLTLTIIMEEELYLLIQLIKNAPIEQIACLIAHESCHVLRKATLEEETTATQKKQLAGRN